MEEYRVYVSKVEQTSEVYDQLERGLYWIGAKELIKPDSRVFIKPNLTIPEYEPGISTSPIVLEALVRWLRARTDNITIGESNGGLEKFTADQAFQGHGLPAIANKYGVKLVNLSRMPRESIRVNRVKIGLPQLLIDQVDVFITVPVLKTHIMTEITLGFKNLWGCIPDSKRLIYHHIFDEAIVAIAKAVRPQISIIDALYAMDKKGPGLGESIKMDTLIIGNNLGATDSVGCRIMNISPSRVGHLKVAQREGLLPDPEQIVTNEELSNFKVRDFSLERDITNWGAYFAFRSYLATKLIYLSPLAVIKNAIVRVVRKGQKHRYGYG